MAAGGALAQRRAATEAQAMSYIHSAFVTAADHGSMSPWARLGPELAQRLALGSSPDARRVYEAVVALTAGTSIEVRKASPEELATYPSRHMIDAALHPVFTVDAGEPKLLVQYDLLMTQILFVGQLGVRAPQSAPQPEPQADPPKAKAKAKPKPKPKPL